ncbi:MAG: hypothetical protein MR371_00330 [Clostridia bacterium]|nr:hypothetical protein [Clostridia bacterium]
MKINAKRVWAALIALAMLLTIAPCAMAEVDKKEVVYVLADANGNTNQVIVSERLYNSAAETEIHDVSRLTDIENLSGDETFTRDGDSIVWAANGAQISYEGNSTEALPFGVKIAYTLDGAEIAPSELAGKSGHLTMHVEYTSNLTGETEVNGVKEEMQMPFMMATAMLVDETVFQNVEITNGKLLSLGDRSIAILYGFPGFAEALKLNDYDDIDVDIPTSAELSADVTDFTFDGAYTLATNSLFGEINEDDNLSIDADLSEMTDELRDAMNQLLDGSSELYDGSQELADGLAELDSNSQKLVDAAKQVLDTVIDTANSTLEESKADFEKLGITLNTLTAENYKSEIERLQQEMLDNLEDYVIQQADQKLASRVDAAVKQEVIKQVKAAARQQVAAEVQKAVEAEVRKQVNASVRAEVEKAVRNPDDETLNATVEAQMKTEAVQKMIREQVEAQMASDTVKALIESNTDEQMKSETVQAQIDAKVKSDYEPEIREKVQQAWDDAYAQIKAAKYDSIKAQVTESYRQAAYKQFENTDPGEGKTIDDLVNEYMAQESTKQAIEAEVEKQLVAATNNMVDRDALIAQNIAEARKQVEAYVRKNVVRPQAEAAVKAEVTKQVEAAAREKIIAQIKGMTEEQIQATVDEKMKDPAIIAKAEAAFQEQMQSDAVKTLINQNINQQMNSETVKALIDQNIAKQLKSDKVKQITNEQMQLNRKSKEYLDGVAEALEENGKDGKAYQALSDLRSTLDDMVDFYQGIIDYTSAVGEAKDGAQQLFEGMGELKDGLNEFNTEAIDKLLSVLDDDLPEIRDRVEAMFNLMRDYTSFAGISDDMTGSVQFLVRSEGV